MRNDKWTAQPLSRQSSGGILEHLVANLPDETDVDHTPLLKKPM
jgi:hypothetical protein